MSRILAKLSLLHAVMIIYLISKFIAFNSNKQNQNRSGHVRKNLCMVLSPHFKAGPKDFGLDFIREKLIKNQIKAGFEQLFWPQEVHLSLCLNIFV